MRYNVLKINLLITLLISQILVGQHLLGQNVDSLYREEVKKGIELQIYIDSLESALRYKTDSIKVSKKQMKSLESTKHELEKQLSRNNKISISDLEEGINSLRDESSELAKSIDSLDFNLKLLNEELRQKRELKNLLEERDNERKLEAHKRVNEMLVHSLFDISREDLTECDKELNHFPDNSLREKWRQVEALVSFKEKAMSLLSKPYSEAVEDLSYKFEKNATIIPKHYQEIKHMCKALETYKSSYLAFEKLSNFLESNSELIYNQDDLNFYLEMFKKEDVEGAVGLIEKSLQDNSLHSYIKKQYEAITTFKN